MDILEFIGQVLTLCLLIGGAFITGLGLGEDNSKCKHEREIK